ncbi:dolichyl pyrophosphate Man9GlcNAc2 alpha-1,3-glucosyltransferase [Melanaphis sacchari]|uniref:dolichyl pyrophosphate Man9GlcNAc2 alpha-1,3-glucosyltransferase n=1 Tax=Melanaphis sacchari TaxID=742174 RepID=UPI000DC13C8B|nr:dolichyl pyrophosphate Man9GlcNAc2 alpha-1,3-glucosyltransferase [Melanaphis sacchari]XP_025206186.1 dolichyl pyrophosphate Man9GlcNAc2 alpha-1,3-glucosyltransferase [Melanaphis sacchari]
MSLHCDTMIYKNLIPIYLKKVLDEKLILMIAVLFRWFVSLHDYSGKSKTPMYGDYEAQRHWMEVTISLSTTQWYFNSSNNDLLYWGLDYPPLTAYHSYLNGLVFKKLLPESVQLNTSRGFESNFHKLLMRYSVLIVDLLIFIPAVSWFFRKFFKITNNNQISQTMIIALTLFYPGLILIDHGHFQYNCVSLGLFVASVACVFANKTILTCLLFSMALNYKQMELYHALPFFFYYIGIVYEIYKKHSFMKALKTLSILVLSVTITFLVLWLPFISDTEQVFQIIHRIFPLERGVFEDKVSNLWCLINVLYKLRNINNQTMAMLCLLTTLISVLPTCLNLLKNPSKIKFLISLINCSLSFFLFSFQVHEKSILLVAIPVLMYAPQNTFMCTWFLSLTTFSMLPLLIRDNLLVPFISLSLIYFIVYNNIEQLISHKKNTSKLNLLRNFSLFGCAVLTFCALALKPPQKYPHLWSLFISVYSCMHFILFLIYFNYSQLILHNPKKKLY